MTMRPGRREWNDGLLLFPVRRKLFFLAWFSLLGILSAPVLAVPPKICAFAAVFLIPLLVLLYRTRRSILFPVGCLLMLLGNLRVSVTLQDVSVAAPVKCVICGTVVGVERDFRVILKDVRLEDGTRLRNPAAVTLLTEDALERTPEIGQTVSGTGKLFRPEEKRNPGGQDARLRNLSRGYWLSGYLIPGWSVKGDTAGSFETLPSGLRARVLRRIDALFGDSAPLYRALLAGDRSELDGDFVSSLREAGIVHILTISGMHISILAFAVSRLLERFRIRGILRQCLSVGLVGLYALIAGFSVGTARAFLMVFLRENAKRAGRKYDPLTALSVAYFALAAYRPALVYTLAFQFSFFIVLGIHLVAPALTKLLIRIWGTRPLEWGLVRTALYCLAAQIAAIPIQLAGYGYFSLLALPFNLAVSFLLPLMVVGSMLCLLLSVPFFALAGGAANLMQLPALALERAAALTERVPGAIVRLPAPRAGTLLCLIVAAALCCPRIRFGKKRRVALAVFSLCAVLGYALRFDPSCRYVQLDVGQGDAAILRTGRHAVLYDTGPAANSDLLQYLRHEGLMVDAVFLSHLDEDHAGGLLKLLESEIRIDRVISAEVSCTEDTAESVQKAWAMLEEKGGGVEMAEAGCIVRTPAFDFQVLGPEEGMKGDNERSLLLLTQAEGVRILLTGDLPISSEPDGIPDIDLLKVAHHGSKKSTSPRFLAESTPVLSLISVGAGNSYGHPTERVLSDLRRAGSQILRTDECGCVTVYLSPRRMRAHPYLGAGALLLQF